ncbi:hypothetical protein BPAE_0016g00270 [Botrytis paeoniae]|uniref:Uncharacterized protein n=1 Tax=Botrytis paeoniae TaxID=278948 RepID=A0A4Z1FXQ6_9HELO|nr:hypothetical protein BPAE_0016g00270 [Botrytis paeoniae]
MTEHLRNRLLFKSTRDGSHVRLPIISFSNRSSSASVSSLQLQICTGSAPVKILYGGGFENCENVED